MSPIYLLAVASEQGEGGDSPWGPHAVGRNTFESISTDMERTWQGLILSWENHFLREVEVAVRERLNSLAFVGLMSSIDMVMRNIFDRKDKDGFQYCCEVFLSRVNPDYGVRKNIDALWRLRVILTHTWASKQLYYLLPDLTPEEEKSGILEPRECSHLQKIGLAYCLSMGQFLDDVKAAILTHMWNHISADDQLQKGADERIGRLF